MAERDICQNGVQLPFKRKLGFGSHMTPTLECLDVQENACLACSLHSGLNLYNSLGQIANSHLSHFRAKQISLSPGVLPDAHTSDCFEAEMLSMMLSETIF